MHFPRTRTCAGAALVALGLAVPGAAGADSLVRARVVVNASNPAAVTVRQELQWNAEGGNPRTELAFHLAPDVAVTAASSEGKPLQVRSEVQPGGTRRWTVQLAVPLSAGSSRPLTLETTIPSDGTPGMHADADGGYLLPGSGWFAALAPETLELPPHTTEFVLPAGWDGIACGTRPAGEKRWTAVPGQPYAAWGAYKAAEAKGGNVVFSVWRRGGSGAEAPMLRRLAELIDAVAVAVGDAPGSGGWKLIDVGGGVAAGGQRTLFWDEGAVAAAKGDAVAGVERGLAAGIGAAFWQEALRFGGEQGAFLSGGLSRYLGDAAIVALDRSDDQWRTEARVIGARRAAFLAGLARDRKLAGLSPFAPDAGRILDTRGALVAHMIADACPTKPLWVRFLNEFRSANQGRTVGMKDYLAALDERFRNQHRFLPPFLDTTDLPDFELAGHEPSSFGTGDRLKIEVVNKGKAAAWAELATFTADDRMLRSTRMLVAPGETRSVLMGDASRIGRIRIDPRGTTLQSAVTNEEVKLEPKAGADASSYVPAFPFSAGGGLCPVQDLSFTLDGVEIRNFSGKLQMWETHHGPSGAVLLGKATVVIHPDARFAETFRTQMGKGELTFQVEDLFLRFPLATWEIIRPALGEAETGKVAPEDAWRRQFIFEHCFPAAFSEGTLAQVPPAGGALVVFGLGGDEWRGYSREPLPNGKVKMRLWDHLRRTPIWEATL